MGLFCIIVEECYSVFAYSDLEGSESRDGETSELPWDVTSGWF